MTVSGLLVHYYHSANAWMTSDIFREWFISCFIPECDPIRDDKLQIQLLLDNCSTHQKDLDFMDPDIAIKFLPANTTSVIQPMDQAVLCSVKARAKKSFYLRLFEYVEQRPESCKTAFNEFVKKYTILDAINAIAQAWQEVPTSTITKSFCKVFHKPTWDKLCGHDFEGFEESLSQFNPLGLQQCPH